LGDHAALFLTIIIPCYARCPNPGDFDSIFSLESRMKYGARNNVVGKIAEIKKGSLMSQVKVSVDGPVDITSVMTQDTLADLGVKKGDSVRVLVKAVNVLLVRE
jgi:molybdopterin-binding protein